MLSKIIGKTLAETDLDLLRLHIQSVCSIDEHGVTVK